MIKESALFLMCCSSLTVGFTSNLLIQKAEISHSGPSIDAEQGVQSLFEKSQSSQDGIKSRRKRAYYFNENQYPNMLVYGEPPNEWMKKWLTFEHNRYRRKVPASDMQMLYWSEELAESAQRHADRCDFRHSRDRYNVGENIWASPYSNYSEAVRLWFEEVNDRRCNCEHAYKHCCGHYVQVVWAKTNLVGCGYSRCRDVWGVQGRGHRHVFVCHYNPQGNSVYVTNTGRLYAVPAFTWATGDKGRCSDCPPEAPACYQGLCYQPSPDDEVRKRKLH